MSNFACALTFFPREPYLAYFRPPLALRAGNSRRPRGGGDTTTAILAEATFMTFARTFVAGPGIRVLREGTYSQMALRIAPRSVVAAVVCRCRWECPVCRGHLKPY